MRTNGEKPETMGLNPITDEATINLNMFNAFMKHQVMSNVKSSLVITK